MASAFGNVTKGAKINMWNTRLAPLSSILLYVGDAQQRQSRLMACTSSLAERTYEKVGELVDQISRRGRAATGHGGTNLTICTTGFMDITPIKMFVRSTLDWDMFKKYLRWCTCSKISPQDRG